MNTKQTADVASGLFRQPQHNSENKLVIPHENGIAVTDSGKAPSVRTVEHIVRENGTHNIVARCFSEKDALLWMQSPLTKGMYRNGVYYNGETNVQWKA